MLLVTGASGLLGASVLLRARDMGQEVAGVSRRHALQVPGTVAHCVDLADQAATRRIIEHLQPTSVIHCAAATNVDWCEDHPEQAHRINTLASSFLAALARELGCRFLHVSTDCVFDGTKGNYSEYDPPGPLNIYARSKLLAEEEVLRQHPAALVVRVNIYGWNAQPKCSLAEWIVVELSSGRQVPGFTEVYFSSLLVNDLAEIVVTMLDRGMTGLYHVAGAEKISKYEFAMRVAEKFGFPVEQVVAKSVSDARLRAPRALDVSLSTNKLFQAYGCSMPDVATGLDEFKSLSQQGYVQQLRSYLTGAEK